MESIVQNRKCCFFCGAESGLDKHHIFGGANRKKSEEDGLWIMCCHTEHVATYGPDTIHGSPNRGKDMTLKMIGEYAWIKARGYDEEEGIKQFVSRYGKNYL